MYCIIQTKTLLYILQKVILHTILSSNKYSLSNKCILDVLLYQSEVVVPQNHIHTRDMIILYFVIKRLSYAHTFSCFMGAKCLSKCL